MRIDMQLLRIDYSSAAFRRAEPCLLNESAKSQRISMSGNRVYVLGSRIYVPSLLSRRMWTILNASSSGSTLCTIRKLNPALLAISPTGARNPSLPGRSDETRQSARYVKTAAVCLFPTSADASSIALMARLLTQAQGPSSGFRALISYSLRSKRSSAVSTRSRR